ncbi:MAG: UDP-N-acetylmuramate dehydrogenase [Candidatus Eiseniibacteriota bacterium]
MKTVDFAADLAQIAGLQVRTDVPLGRLTTFKIGGPAAVVATPSTVEALAKAQRFLHEAGAPVLVMGNGSNLLVADSGFDGVVLRVGNTLSGIELAGPDRVRVGAGTMWNRLLRFAMSEGWTGLEFGAGIPGTLGGAVATNAGTRGGETSGALVAADIVTVEGEVRTLSNADLRFRYRNCELPLGAAVASTLFGVHREDPAKVTETIKRYQAERRRDQPEREPSAGCVFKNPPGTSAGRLIDQAGLKGEFEGGAIVSPVHGNFIINRGGATASDVLRLVERIRERIRRDHAIELELEVRLVGLS